MCVCVHVSEGELEGDIDGFVQAPTIYSKFFLYMTETHSSDLRDNFQVIVVGVWKIKPSWGVSRSGICAVARVCGTCVRWVRVCMGYVWAWGTCGRGVRACVTYVWRVCMTCMLARVRDVCAYQYVCWSQYTYLRVLTLHTQKISGTYKCAWSGR